LILNQFLSIILKVMGFLKRTNKKFDYQPRYYKGEGSPFKIEHKLDKFRTTAGKNKGLKSKFSEAVNDLNNSDKGANKTIIYIVIILVLIFLFIIDFDLSIFYSK
jgi:hypothetical protein